MSKAKFVDWRKVKPSPLILIFGSEEYLYSSTIRRLKDDVRASDTNVEIYEIEASDYVAGDLINMISPSLFSEPKLVVIAGVERATDALIEDGKAVDVADLTDVTLVFQHAGQGQMPNAALPRARGFELTGVGLDGGQQIVDGFVG